MGKFVSKTVADRARHQQHIGFDGMTYGKCRPTDIDATMDWQGDTFVFIEVKTGKTNLTTGQQIYFRNVVDAIRAGGKAAYGIHVSHEVSDKADDVELATTEVIQYYDGLDAEGNVQKGAGWKRANPGTLLHDYLTELWHQHTLRRKQMGKRV